MYQDIICDGNNIMGHHICIGADFYMPLNLSWCQFKLACYKFRIVIVNPMGNSRKISEKYSEKDMKRESKWCTTKKSNTKEESTGGNEKHEREKVYRKQTAKWQR